MSKTDIIKRVQPSTKLSVNKRMYKEYKIPKNATIEVINPTNVAIFNGVLENDKIASLANAASSLMDI